MSIIEKLKRVALRPFERGDHSADGERRVENTDAMAAAAGGAGKVDPNSGMGHAGAPPGYVKTDDGRPRH
jgi:hypothetical protein